MTSVTSATIKKTIRVFVFAFVALYPLSNVIGNITGSQPVNVSALEGAAAAGLTAVVTFLWNQFIDPSPIPSLKVGE